jgi:DNA mismatch repair protein MutS
MPNWTRCGRCATVAQGDRRAADQYIDETGVKSLKIKYNNVLGYFIEVTQQNAAALTGTDEAKGRFIHRQTLANAMRFTTTELADLESRIANAADRALAIELESSTSCRPP